MKHEQIQLDFQVQYGSVSVSTSKHSKGDGYSVCKLLGPLWANIHVDSGRFYVNHFSCKVTRGQGNFRLDLIHPHEASSEIVFPLIRWWWIGLIGKWSSRICAGMAAVFSLWKLWGVSKVIAFKPLQNFWNIDWETAHWSGGALIVMNVWKMLKWRLTTQKTLLLRATFSSMYGNVQLNTERKEFQKKEPTMMSNKTTKEKMSWLKQPLISSDEFLGEPNRNEFKLHLVVNKFSFMFTWGHGDHRLSTWSSHHPKFD